MLGRAAFISYYNDPQYYAWTRKFRGAAGEGFSITTGFPVPAVQPAAGKWFFRAGLKRITTLTIAYHEHSL